MSLPRLEAVPSNSEIHLDMNEPSQHLDTHIFHGIESLSITHFDNSKNLSTRFLHFSTSFPSLQSLCVRASYPSHDGNLSSDPFRSLPRTLKRLTLCDVPLYPSFCQLQTLTNLHLDCGAFDHTLDTLLEVLDRNPSLKDVDLRIQFKSRELRRSNRRVPVQMTNNLKYLGIASNEAEDIKALISQVTLSRGVVLAVKHSREAEGFRTILSDINTTRFKNLASPIHMEYAHGLFSMFSGEEGGLVLKVDDDLPCNGALSFGKIRECPVMGSLCRTIQLLDLTMHRQPGVFEPSLFPALEILIINRDSNLKETLAELFSLPHLCPELKALEFLKCDISGEFTTELTQYVSARKRITSGQLLRITIVHKEVAFDGGDLIKERLEGHVQKLWVGQNPPPYLRDYLERHTRD